MAILTHKIELVPNKVQAAFFQNCAGASRFFWNWSLNAWNEMYEAGNQVNDSILRKAIVQAKKGDEFPWINEIPSACISNTVIDLGIAFRKWFSSLKEGGGVGRPKFKAKHRVRPTFHPWDHSNVNVKGKRVRIPGLGFVKMRESLRFAGKILSCSSVVNDGGRWYVCLSVEVEGHKKERTGSDRIGVDLGCSELAVCSNGWRFIGAKPTRRLARRLARSQRKLSRRMKGSANRAKAKLEVQAIHRRIANIRSNYTHHVTTKLVLESSDICLEDLNVKGMARSLNLGKSVHDQAFGEFRRQVEYKASLYGCRVHVVDRFYPSSKTCHVCGTANKELKLCDRKWTCSCGAVHDRDVNAAMNLRNQIPVLDREFTPVESTH